MTRSTTATRSFTALLVAAGFAVSLGAQTPPPSPQPSTPDQPKPAEKRMGSADAKSVTVTGCVREGDMPNSFVLANADVSSIPGLSSGSSATGTSGSASTATLGLTSSGVDLKPHVGHKVEVTGTVAPAMGRPSGTSGTPEAGAPSAGDKDKKAKINVTAVKHVSDSCTM
jgi:hypothetical protein